MTKYKPRVLVDFDATIHLYYKGWHDGTAYDKPMAGAKEAIIEMQERGYGVIIFTTRDRDQVDQWLIKYNFPDGMNITNHKLPAVAIIDDRAIHHTDWYTSLDELYERYPILDEDE